MKTGTMLRLACGILAVGACGFGVVRAQKKVHVDRPIVEARAEDVSTIEGIVKASYETISGGVGVPREGATGPSSIRTRGRWRWK